ncbi:MAG: malto-oligosyltrehalose synthase, partial [Candidatus Hydrogenedentota bacterium]
PDRRGVTTEEFHGRNIQRQIRWPHSFSSTSTHDTKRSEDVRARINVLSEIPDEWNEAVLRWSHLNKGRKRMVNEEAVPGPNKEILLYQTLVGTYPFESPTEPQLETYIGRIEQYMEKATKEAKARTSWIKPNLAYDQAIRAFVHSLLTPDEENAFLPDFRIFQSRIARVGVWNSLTQAILKIASPGVPEIYQGNELWDFSLVDPDNRRPVDFEMRCRILASLQATMNGSAGNPGDRLAAIREFLATVGDGRIKMYILNRGLEFRRGRKQLFREGAYTPLSAQGGFKDNVVAFARDTARESCLAVAGRWYIRLGAPDVSPTGSAWRDTELLLPEKAAGSYREILTDRIVTAEPRGDTAVMKLSDICFSLPVALLDRCDTLAP